MTDYRTLLAEAAWLDPDGYDVDCLLATRIPDLCPDCDQGDVKYLPYSQTCAHPNAPTIADLLQWGENVAMAEAGFKVTDRGTLAVVYMPHPVGRRWTLYAVSLLAALRGEGQ